jgi:hypothetical protein
VTGTHPEDADPFRPPARDPSAACEQCGAREHAESRPARTRSRPGLGGAWLCDGCFATHGPRLADASADPTTGW